MRYSCAGFLIMNTSVQKTVVAASLAVLGIFYPVSAIPLWNVDFNHMPTGAPPVIATAAGGVVNTNPTALTIEGSNNTVVVQDSFTAGSATLADRPLVWTQVAKAYNNPTNLSSIALYFANSTDYESPADYFLEFDLLIRANPSSHPLSIRMYSASKMLLRTYFDINTSFACSSSSVGYPYVAYPVFTDAWHYEEVTRVRIYFNSLEGSFTFKINGKKLGSAYFADWNAVPSTEKGIKQVIIQSWSVNTSTLLAIDNISTRRLPPGTVISFE